MIFRVSATAWLLSASAFATAAGAVGVGLRTDAGRDVLARYGIAVLNDVVHGTAEVGEVTGTMTDGLEARDVVIRGEDGTLLGIWKGDKVQGTWWVENDIRCYDVEKWGGEWCHKYYLREGEIVGHRVGTDTIKEGAFRIEPGNQVPE